MRIAILQTSFIPINLDLCGGLERVVLEEATRLMCKGHAVTLSGSAYVGNSRPGWVNLIKEYGLNKRVIKWFYPIKYRSNNLNANIYHGHLTPYLPIVTRKNTVIHYHGLIIKELPLYRYQWARDIYHKAHYVFCSQYLRDKYLEYYPALPKDHLHVLYNAVDHMRFAPKGNHKTNNVIKFAFHGRWDPTKGIEVLLKAISILERKRKDFECHIVGSELIGFPLGGNKVRDNITRAAQTLKTLKVHDKINYSDLPAFINKIDFGIVPSTCQESFGLANIEYMSCGKPVVATKVGGIPEVIEDGQTGILVDPNDENKLAAAIEYYLDNISIVRTMGEKARKRVLEHFTWDGHMDKLEKIYNRVVNE